MSVDRGGSDRSHPIDEAGGPGDGEASNDTGDNSKDAKESRFVRLRRSLSRVIGEPSASESPPAEPGAPTGDEPPFPQGPAPSPPKPLISLDPDDDEEKTPERAGELAFRARTRFQAMGYWLREKGQIAWRALRRGVCPGVPLAARGRR